MKLNKLGFILIGILIGGISTWILMSNNLINKASSQPLSSIKNQEKNTGNEITTEFLDLPLEYFSKEDVQWGSLMEGSRDDTKMTNYDEAAIKNIAVYQSYPVTSTTIESYSNESIDLKLLSQTETQKQIASMQMDQYKAEKSYEEFGVLVSHYLPDEYIFAINKFDVDADGVNESIIDYTQTFTAGFGSYRADIMKGNKIIFSVTEDNASIIPAETPNGFYVEWGAVGEFSGRCCEEGIKRTRFVFKDGQFVPLYEQEVRYLKIGKE